MISPSEKFNKFAFTSEETCVHISPPNPSNNVQGAVVTSLAFMLFKNPSQVPQIVQLLSKGYNPHVCCGMTLALGIVCMSTGLHVGICS